MSDEDRRRRAEDRRLGMTLRRTRVGEPEHDLSPVRGAEAISLATQLTRMSFGLAAIAASEYPRSEIPVRFVPRAGG